MVMLPVAAACRVISPVETTVFGSESVVPLIVIFAASTVPFRATPRAELMISSSAASMVPFAVMPFPAPVRVVVSRISPVVAKTPPDPKVMVFAAVRLMSAAVTVPAEIDCSGFADR